MIGWIKTSDKYPYVGQYIGIEHEEKIYLCIYLKDNQAFPFPLKKGEMPLLNFDKWIPLYFY